MLNKKLDKFLDETLIKAEFNPEEDDFDILKEDMLPILEEFLELKLYEKLDNNKKSEYDKTTTFEIDFFEKNISEFDSILNKLLKERQDKYLAAFNED